MVHLLSGAPGFDRVTGRSPFGAQFTLFPGDHFPTRFTSQSSDVGYAAVLGVPPPKTNFPVTEESIDQGTDAMRADLERKIRESNPIPIICAFGAFSYAPGYVQLKLHE